jgi:hypothetical protein
MTALALPRRTHPLIVLAAALVTAIVGTAVWQLWPEANSTVRHPTTPSWFQPISRYYHDDPRITPQFDFASAYSGLPAWFEPIAEYYQRNPNITPSFDFASLYGPRVTTRR